MFPNKSLDGYAPRVLVSDDFIIKNKLVLRNTDEILKKISEVRDEDMFGFYSGVIASFIKLEDGVGIFSDEYIARGEHGVVSSIEEAAQDFLDYMIFAHMKSEDCRGLSASRSIEKLGAWLWVMGRDDLSALINSADLYNPYGAPALIKVCEEMGIPVSDGFYSFAKKKV